MPVPRFCPQPDCPNHHNPSRAWRVRFGTYSSLAHGTVQRYRCTSCGHTFSDQTESLHFFAKRRLPLVAIWNCLLGGSCLREIARRYHTSRPAVQNAILRLGRQAMAAQILLLDRLPPLPVAVFDGLRSFLCSQDYPCELLTSVSSAGELILQICHFISRRSGKATEAQKLRMRQRYQLWSPPKGALKHAISSLLGHLWPHLCLATGTASLLHSDEQPFYHHFIQHDPAATHLQHSQLLAHLRTDSTAPRTLANPLFPVNYIDRLLRHRLKEHTRESIAFGRNATLQMHRAWIFALDHNLTRPHRTRHPHDGSHALFAGAPKKLLSELSQGFFTRRIRLYAVAVPTPIAEAWLATLPTPPVRRNQKGTSVRVPDYARRDLADAYQHAS